MLNLYNSFLADITEVTEDTASFVYENSGTWYWRHWGHWSKRILQPLRTLRTLKRHCPMDPMLWTLHAPVKHQSSTRCIVAQKSSMAVCQAFSQLPLHQKGSATQDYACVLNISDWLYKFIAPFNCFRVHNCCIEALWHAVCLHDPFPPLHQKKGKGWQYKTAVTEETEDTLFTAVMMSQHQSVLF